MIKRSCFGVVLLESHATVKKWNYHYDTHCVKGVSWLIREKVSEARWNCIWNHGLIAISFHVLNTVQSISAWNTWHLGLPRMHITTRLLVQVLVCSQLLWLFDHNILLSLEDSDNKEGTIVLSFPAEGNTTPPRCFPAGLTEYWL